MADKNNPYYGRLYSKDEVERVTKEHNDKVNNAYQELMDKGMDPFSEQGKEYIRNIDKDGLAHNTFLPEYRTDENGKMELVGYSISGDPTDFSKQLNDSSYQAGSPVSSAYSDNAYGGTSSKQSSVSSDNTSAFAGGSSQSQSESTSHFKSQDSKPDDLKYSDDLKGRSSEDTASNKSQATAQNNANKGKWTAGSGTENLSVTAAAGTHSDTGSKVSSSDGENGSFARKSYSSEDDKKGSRFASHSEGEMNDFSAHATDQLGRSLDVGRSALDKGTLKKRGKEKNKEEIAAERKEKGQKKFSVEKVSTTLTDKISKAQNAYMDSSTDKDIPEEEVQRANELARKAGTRLFTEAQRKSQALKQAKAEDARSAFLSDNVHASDGKEKASARTAHATGTRSSTSSARAEEERSSSLSKSRTANVSESSIETKTRTAKVSAGGSERRGIKTNKGADRGFVRSDSGRGSVSRSLSDGLKAAESASGRKFVTGNKNSYGSMVKDVKNNFRVIDGYFKKKGINLSILNSADIKAAIRKGFMFNDKNEKVALTESDTALLNERLKLMKKRKAMQSTGTWKDDVGDINDALFGGSDAYEGYKDVRNALRGAKSVANAGKNILKGTAKAGKNARIAGNTIKGGLKSFGADSATKKSVRKWRVDENGKFKARNSKITATERRVKGFTGKVIDSPLGMAGRGIGRGIGKGAGALKGSFTKAERRKGERTFSIRRILSERKKEAEKKIAQGAARRAARSGGLLLGDGGGAAGVKVRIIALLMVVILLLSSSLFIVAGGLVAAIVPGGADKATYDDEGRNTLWEESKDGVNQEIQQIGDDAMVWLSKNYMALRKRRRGGKAMTYTPTFILNGIEFDGPSNNVSDRDPDSDTESGDGDSATDTSTSDSGSGSDLESSSDTTITDNSNSVVPQTSEDVEKFLDTAGKYKTSAYKSKFYSGHNGSNLTKSKGTIRNKWGVKETYYNMDMANIEYSLKKHFAGTNGTSSNAHAFERSDGVKMFGDDDGVAYVMVAADLSIYPKGTLVHTSVGPGVVCDTGVSGQHFDIAVNEQWHGQAGGTNSGTIDVWGSGLNAGASFVDGRVACSSNYLRSMLAMVTRATGNEEEPEYQPFYEAYLRHLVRNSYNYSKYVAATYWNMDQTSEVIDSAEDNYKLAWDDDYVTDEKLGGVAFELSVYDQKYNKYGHLIATTYSVTLRFLNCGLWGQKDLADETTTTLSTGEESVQPAGSGSSPDVIMTGVGMFDVETYLYTAIDQCGNLVTNEICDDDFLHAMAGGKSTEYYELDKNARTYEEWPGWAEHATDLPHIDDGIYIYESGSRTSAVEGTYDLSNEDFQDMGISFDGIYNYTQFTDEEAGASGGKTAKALSDADIQSMLDSIKEQIGDDPHAEERLAAVSTALNLIGTAHYKRGGMHKSYKTRRGDADYSDWDSVSDCSGFVSYCLYKGGAKAFTTNAAQTTTGLSGIGSQISKTEMKPGDIIVKLNGDHDSHVVMYLGKTKYGDFTVAESTTRSGQDGPQLNGYSRAGTAGDFWNKRGSNYSYIRNVY